MQYTLSIASVNKIKIKIVQNFKVTFESNNNLKYFPIIFIKKQVRTLYVPDKNKQIGKIRD